MQRVRIGLTGLAFVFLLVLLGTAISRWGNEGVEPNEPLAELGVAPGESSAANGSHNKQ
jgi:hypothetical protein